MHIPIFDEKDHIDEKGCLAIYGNSYEFYVSVLETFLKGSRKEIEELKRYKAEGDKESYRVIVHGLKSSAASVGSNELAEFTTKWDEMWKSGNHVVVSIYHEELIEKLSDVIELISDRLSRD